MRRFELIVPCHFGMESVLKREIVDLGYDIADVSDGRVTFYGDEEALCRANIFLRTGERVLIKIGTFRAESFEELFQGTKSLPWEEYIPMDGKFWVAKASSIRSKLLSSSDIQSIMKKAMVERLQSVYHIKWFEESGESFPIRVFLMKNQVTVGLDSTGEPLHKRGYRRLTAKAPIAENLAAALIMLTPWNKDRILVDPFCGSGTIPIEAAMMAARMAPGMNRSFIAEKWDHIVSKRIWYNAMDEASDLVDLNVRTDIQGYDIDEEMIEIARENAALAGVDRLIHFQRRGVEQLSHAKKYGFLIRQLVSRDFKTKYKRSILGVLWSFLNPLLMMCVQYFVFSNIFKSDIPNFATYLLIGTVMFNFFTESCGMALTSILGNASLITKVYMPKYIYPLTRVLSSLINLAISLIPLVIVCMATGIHFRKSAVLALFFLACLVIFCLGFGLLLSTSMVFFRDTQFLWGVLSMMWMYATPIFYPENILPENFRFILQINPLYHFLKNTRMCIMDGLSPEPVVYVQCFLIALAALLIGALVFHKNQDKFVLYL